MTYHGVLARMLELMYVGEECRWVHDSYQSVVKDFLERVSARFRTSIKSDANSLENPSALLEGVLKKLPQSNKRLLHPEDVQHFVAICQRKGRKPVNFIPRLDDNFETWFKKDSLWQSQDVNAVVDQDAGRVCILQGPVAVKYAKKVDEPAKDILDGIHRNLKSRATDDFGIIQELRTHSCEKTPTAVPRLYGAAVRCNGGEITVAFRHEDALPPIEEWSSWLTAAPMSHTTRTLCTSETILRGKRRVQNPLRSILRPSHARTIKLALEDKNGECLFEVHDEGLCTAQAIKMEDGQVAIDVSEARSASSSPAKITFYYNFDQSSHILPLSEQVEGRNQRIQNLYRNLWFGDATIGESRSNTIHFKAVK